MKSKVAILFALFFCFGCAMVSASPKGKDDAFQSRQLPVLVKVDSHGKVTESEPAYRLRPSLKRELHGIIQKMITKPAMDHGKPTASQFVINFNMVATAQENGGYAAKFKYVSIKPLPTGDWHWTHSNDHQLALADQSSQIMPIAKSLQVDPVPPIGEGKGAGRL